MDEQEEILKAMAREHLNRQKAFEQEYRNPTYTPNPEIQQMHQEMRYGLESINRDIQDIRKTLDTLQLMEKLQRPAEMAKWLKELGLENFEIVKIMDQINKQRKDRNNP